MKNLRKYYVLTLALSLALGSCEKEEPLEQISELEDVALGEDTGLEVDAKLDALLDKELRGKTYMLNDAGEQVSSEDFFKKKARSQNTSWDPDRYDDVPNQSKILPISEYYKFGFFPNQNLSIAKAEKGAIKYLEEVKGLDLSYDLGYTKGYGQVTFSMASRSYNTDSPNNRPDLGYTPNLRVALYSDRQAPTQNNLGVWRIAGPGQIFKALPDRRIELNGTHSTFRTTKTTSVKKGNTQGLNYTASGTLEWEAKALFASVKQSATISIGGDNTWTNESQTIDTETSTFHLKYAKGDFVPKGQKCLFQPYKKKVRVTTKYRVRQKVLGDVKFRYFDFTNLAQHPNGEEKFLHAKDENAATYLFPEEYRKNEVFTDLELNEDSWIYGIYRSNCRPLDAPDFQ